MSKLNVKTAVKNVDTKVTDTKPVNKKPVAKKPALMSDLVKKDALVIKTGLDLLNANFSGYDYTGFPKGWGNNVENSFKKLLLIKTNDGMMDLLVTNKHAVHSLGIILTRIEAGFTKFSFNKESYNLADFVKFYDKKTLGRTSNQKENLYTWALVDTGNKLFNNHKSTNFSFHEQHFIRANTIINSLVKWIK